MKICFQTSAGRICIPLYAIRDPWRRPPPPDGPIDRIIREELPMLAAVERFAVALPDGRPRTVLTQALTEVTRALQGELGDGVTIHLGEPEGVVEVTPIQLP